MKPKLIRLCRLLLIAAVVFSIVPDAARSTTLASNGSILRPKAGQVFHRVEFVQVPLDLVSSISLSGQILDRFDTPAVNLRVQVILRNGQALDEVRTASNGAFYITFLETDSYHLQILNQDGRPLPWESTSLIKTKSSQHSSLIEQTIRLHNEVVAKPKALADTSEDVDSALNDTLLQAKSSAVENELNVASSVQVTLQGTGEISGTVTALNDSQPLEEVFVRLYNADGDRVTSAFTDDNGIYRFTQLDPGSYKLEFTPSLSGGSNQYLPEFFNDKPNIDSATLIIVGDNQRVAADTQLAKGGTLEGIVTGGEAPLSSVVVRLYNADGKSIDTDITDESGAYRIVPLPPGDYRVLFVPSSVGESGQFLPEYYEDQSMLARATPVTIVADETVTTNAELSRGGTIEGTVTGEGNPLDQVSVRLYDSQDNIVDSDLTDETGSYTLQPLPPGNYKLLFEPSALNAAIDFLPEYYDNQPTRDAATNIAILGSETVPVNAELILGGQIQGQVTTEDEATPLADIKVTLYDEASSYLKQTSTDATGFYTITGLPTGGYHLRYDPPDFGSATEYVTEYYEDKSSLSQADIVQVMAPNVTSNVDVQLKRSGRITGQVTAAALQRPAQERRGATPLSAIHVSAYDLSGRLVESTTTDSSGVYTITRLADGVYWIDATPSRNGPNMAYLQGHYLDPVTVTAPNVVNSIDFTLNKGAQIVGRVTNSADSLPVGGVDVELYDAVDAYFMHSATTGSAGYYTSTGLYSGTYQVKFDPPNGGAINYLDAFYGGSSNLPASTPVHVTNLPLVSGINAVLEPGGQISGTVTAADTSAPLSAIVVVLYDTSDEEVDTAFTEANGRYLFSGLPTGSYRVQFQPQANSAFRVGSPYLKAYYNGSANLDAADPIDLTAPAIIPDVSAALAVGGEITGTVTAGNTGQPLAEVWVRLYDEQGREVGTALTDEPTGVYKFHGLIDGTYRLRFEPSPNTSSPSHAYMATYSGGKANLPSAEQITISGANTSISNVTLAQGGQITGKIVDATDSRPIPGVSLELFSATSGGEIGRLSTDAQGIYRTQGLPADSYWLAIATSRRLLGPIDVTAPNLVENIDGTLQPQALTQGIVAGRVVSRESSRPLSGVWVSLDGCGKHSFDSTNHLGVYYFRELPSGDYAVRLEPSNQSPAAPYQMARSAIQLGADGPLIERKVMERGARITGKVTAADTSQPLGAVSVTVYDATGDFVGFTETDELGQYTTVGLSSDTYRLGFRPDDASGYQTRYSGGQTGLTTAQTIAVSSPTTVANQNIALPQGGRISGMVTASDSGFPLDGVEITVYDSNGTRVAFAETDEEGRYRTRGLPNGDYRLFFESGYRDDNASYVSAYYLDKGDLPSAATVTISGLTQVDDVNIALSGGSQIAGFVTTEQNNQPLEEVDVHVYDAAGNRIARGNTNRVGFYQTNAVGPGDYRIRFAPEYDSCLPDEAYAEEYYANKADLASANPIPVSGNNATEEIDAQLNVLAGTATPTSTSSPATPDATPTPVPPSNQSKTYLPLTTQD